MSLLGEPEDVEGECNARLMIGDNFGDNHATMRCQLAFGHEGDHCEVFRDGQARATWSSAVARCGGCAGRGWLCLDEEEGAPGGEKSCTRCGGTGEFKSQ